MEGEIIEKVILVNLKPAHTWDFILNLAGNVANMSATCQQRVEMSPILTQHACRCQQKNSPDTEFCLGEPPTPYIHTHHHTHNPNLLLRCPCSSSHSCRSHAHAATAACPQQQWQDGHDSSRRVGTRSMSSLSSLLSIIPHSLSPLLSLCHVGCAYWNTPGWIHT